MKGKCCMQEVLNNILKQLMSGDLSCLNPNNIKIVSDEALRLLNKDKLDNYDIANRLECLFSRNLKVNDKLLRNIRLLRKNY